MAYLLTTHIVKGISDLSPLNDLPKEISYKAYRDSNSEFLCIDFFSTGKENTYPFQRMLPATGLPLEFEGSDHCLNDLYESLKKSQAANSFKRALVNLNKLVSGKLETEVLSIASDDDSMDMSVHSDNGQLKSLIFRAEDIEVAYDCESISIQPLLTEDEEALVDLALFSSDKFSVKSRDKEMSTNLHDIASQSVKLFLGINEPILGLGKFDPEPINLIELKSDKKWWQFWK